jgi:hypothetical protein
MNAWLLILVLWLPWNYEYLSDIASDPIWCYAATPAGHPERIGWYDGEIHIVDCKLDAETQRRLAHETQHHLAIKHDIGDWKAFIELAKAEVFYSKTKYSEHQRGSFIGALRHGHRGVGSGFELHAELPLILEGQLPESLQPWYPWFDLGGQ